MFLTFWICCNTSGVPSRKRIYWFNCYFNHRGDNIINCSQNSVLDSILKRVNNITYFSINPISRAFFQCLNIHRILIRCRKTFNIIYGKITPTGPLLITNICLSLPTASPMVLSWSKQSNWLKSLLLCCLFFRVENKFALTSKLHLS